MAHLLGGKFNIESLRNDVTDLQECVIDVFSRAGPVRYPSWKYPDKISSDLDMTEIMELYDYSDNEEDCQVSHVVLLELVIDRLLLFIQSLTRYIDQAASSPKRPATGHQSSNSTSVGLVAKKYLNKMVHVQTYIQHLQSENKTLKRRVSELEEEVKLVAHDQREFEKSLSNGQQHDTSTPRVYPLNKADSVLSGKLTSCSNFSISRDACNKSSQTYVTAFVPCESCHYVQRNLRETGDAIISCCTSQGLPSSLLKYKSQVEGLEWFTGNDVARWSGEQTKDVNRFSKHLEYLTSTIEPLKAELAAQQKKNTDMQNKVSQVTKEIKLEKETQSQQQKQYENKLQNIVREKTDIINKTKRQNMDLDKQLEQMKEALTKQETLCKEIEGAKSLLEADLHESKTNNAQVRALEEEMSAINERLEEVTTKLGDTQKELSKEKAKGRSASKHTESIQSKQDNLVSRIDDMDRENEDLRTELAELEDEKDRLEESLDRAQDEKNKLVETLEEQKALVAEISKEKSELTTSMADLKNDISHLEKKVKEAKEHERLLVEYPDLNGPVNPDFQGSGDITQDMENQVKANALRIQVLEEQNNNLRRTVNKMLETRVGPQTQAKPPPGPVTLWNTTSPPQANERNYSSESDQEIPPRPRVTSGGTRSRRYSPASPDENNYTKPPKPPSAAPQQNNKPIWTAQPLKNNVKIKSPPKEEPTKSRSLSNAKYSQGLKNCNEVEKSFVVGTGTNYHGEEVRSKSRTSERPRSRPQSAVKVNNKTAEGSASSISAYMKLKNSGLLKTESRPKAEELEVETVRTDYDKHPVFICPKCDKVYHSERDLDVHRSYCFGGFM